MRPRLSGPLVCGDPGCRGRFLTVVVICRYGWRLQIKPWVEAGYRVVVPDKLGYGGTDKPRDEAEYTAKKICADLAALLDLLQVSKAVSQKQTWRSVIC